MAKLAELAELYVRKHNYLNQAKRWSGGGKTMDTNIPTNSNNCAVCGKTLVGEVNVYLRVSLPTSAGGQ